MIDTSEFVDVVNDCMAMEKEFTSLLKRLVRIETPSGNPKSHQKIFTLLESEFDSLGFETQKLPGLDSGGQLYARPEKTNGEGYQLLLGHADTVWPKGTLKKMPFKKEGNIIRGPGIYDMKAGLTMIIMALKLVEKLGLDLELSPVVFINSDEEVGSKESVKRIKTLAKVMDRALVFEPSLDLDGKLKTRRKGVGHFDIEIKGVSSHAGIEPEKGRSAIVELSYLIQKLNELNDPENGISVNVGKIGGGTNTNVVAGESSAAVDVRVLTKKDAKHINQMI